MKRSLFLKSFIIAIISVCLSTFVSAIIMQNIKEDGLKKSAFSFLDEISKLSSFSGDNQSLATELSKLFYGYRITIINVQNGEVSGDSEVDPKSMDNHFNRSEVQGAIQNGHFFIKRLSNTLNRKMLYMAVDTGKGYVVRASIAAVQLNLSLFEQLPAVLIGLLVALIISSILAFTSTRLATNPIDQVINNIEKIGNGEYDFFLQPPKYKEFLPLISSVNHMTEGIHDNLEKLQFERQKLEFLLDSMRQGLIVVDGNLNILHVNKSAYTLLNVVDDGNKNQLLELTRSTKIVSAVENCLKNKTSSIFEKEMENMGSVYSIAVHFLQSQWVRNGAIIIITDVTQDKKSEQIRREFIANASHELKTPITSIRGFAELLSSGLVNDEVKISEYLNRIQIESDRMTDIITDILRLSSLEDKEKQRSIEILPVLDMVQEIKQSLMPQAEAKGVKIQATGNGNLKVAMEKDHLWQLVRNLMDNAIKYNNENGYVDVSVAEERNKCVITIKDNGIGIPQADIPRIFERFYRVDKGRSRSVGGTGLGLSIVKHIVSEYSGEIMINSSLNSGTEFIIKFDKA